MTHAEIEGLICGIAKRLSSEYYGVEREELEAQGWLIVTEKIGGYEPDKGASLSTYLHSWVDKELRRYIIWNLQRGENMKGLRDWPDQYDDEVPGPEAQVAARIDTERILSSLTEQERDILWYTAEGYTQKEVASMVGLSQQRVGQVLASVRQRLQEDV